MNSTAAWSHDADEVAGNLAMTITGPRIELEKQAAGIIRDSAFRVLRSKKNAVLAVPGGRSVSGIFRLLMKDRFMPWDNIQIFMVDERLVPITDEQSNFRLANETFLRYLIDEGRLPKDNVHPFVMDSFKSDFGAGKYADELKVHGGAYDIVLLSSGEDGHVGGLYPGHHSITDESDFFLVMHDSPKPPKDRMTMSRKLLLGAGTALLLFFGEGKRDAFEMFSKDKAKFVSCPARLVHEIKTAYAFSDTAGEKG